MNAVVHSVEAEEFVKVCLECVSQYFQFSAQM